MAKTTIERKRTAKRGGTVKKSAGKTSRQAAKGKAAGKSSKKPRSSKKAGRASKPAKTRVRSAALVDQSYRIHCEARMFRSAVSLLTGDGSGSRSVEDRAHRNALSESFCLHFRNLLDFLWEGRAEKKGAAARDFFATPRRWKPAKPQDYRDLKKRLAKEIEALTTTCYSDLSIEEWPYRRIFDAIFVDLDRFQSTAPAENLHECWRASPIAALSAAGTRASTVAGRSKVESDVEELELTGTGTETKRTAAVAAGSSSGRAESSRTIWSSRTDEDDDEDEDDEDDEDEDAEEYDESREEAPLFASGFSALGKDD